MLAVEARRTVETVGHARHVAELPLVVDAGEGGEQSRLLHVGTGYPRGLRSPHTVQLWAEEVASGHGIVPLASVFVALAQHTLQEMVAKHLVHVDEVVHDNLVVQLRGFLRLVAGHATQSLGQFAFANVRKRVINVRTHLAPQGNPVRRLVLQIAVAHHAGVFHALVVDISHGHGVVCLWVAFRVGRVAVVIIAVVAIDGQVGGFLQRGGINLAGLQCIVVQPGERHVNSQVQVLVQFRVQVQAGGEPLHVVVDDVRLVVVVGEAHEIRGTSRPAGDRSR